ncbi:MAG: GEVED domain-containing protein [Bacteroidota bacterium]
MPSVPPRLPFFSFSQATVRSRATPVPSVFSFCLGADVNMDTTFLLDFNQANNPFFLRFELEFGDPLVRLNNLPVIGCSDFGDLPDDNMVGSYPTDTINGAGEGIGPRHLIDTLIKIGAIIDQDQNGQPSANADGDDTGDTEPTDDEDGLDPIPTFSIGETTSLSILVMNQTGSEAKMVIFVDWNADGDFDEGDEMYSTTVANNGTAANIDIDVPITAAVETDLGLRIRFSTDQTAVMSPVGLAQDGEVEDYIIQAQGNFDYGDLPDLNVPGTYATNILNNGEGIGAAHFIIDDFRIGATIDDETDGQPNSAATDDGADEDGVQLPNTFYTGQTGVEVPVTVEVPTGTNAQLIGWIDWNGDGILSPSEASSSSIITGQTNVTQNVILIFDVPMNANTVRPLGARFRLFNSNESSQTSTGTTLLGGEVEDYLIGVRPCPKNNCR